MYCMAKERSALERERRRARLSQADLAHESGVSQSTISRIERGVYNPGLDVFAKLARSMGVPVSDIAPEAISQLNDPEDEAFFAFCQNLLCDRNELTTDSPGGIAVLWKSYQQFPITSFGEVNFCTSCGEELVKKCPSCTRRLQRGARYCLVCGTRIVEPTTDDWAAAKELYEARKSQDDDDDVPF